MHDWLPILAYICISPKALYFAPETQRVQRKEIAHEIAATQL
jgi:hypothetical protein